MRSLQVPNEIERVILESLAMLLDNMFIESHPGIGEQIEKIGELLRRGPIPHLNNDMV